MIGFAIGYVLGTRAGSDGYEELLDAWKTISSSEEVKEMLVGGLSMARDMAKRGRILLADRLAVEDGRELHPVA